MADTFPFEKLSNILQFSRGFDITKAQQKSGEIPVVSSSGITSYNDKHKCKSPGVVTGRKGTLGKVFYIKQDFWAHDTTLWVKDFKGNNAKYIYYLLTQLHLESYDVGSSNPTLNRNHIHKLYVQFEEDKKKQKQISDFLSLYDDLIEVNNQRIKILQETATQLYKEWFVRMRFPEYEKLNFIRGIPEGWLPTKVGKLIRRVSAGKRYELKTALSQGKVPILDQGETGLIGYHNDDPGVNASLESPVIVFANHTCYQRLINFPFSSIQNVLPFKATSDSNMARNIYWLHFATEGLIEFSEYKGHWPQFILKEIYLPPNDICERFGEIAKKLVEAKNLFEQQNELLSKARDLLIPRVLSGKLRVAQSEHKKRSISI